MSPLLLIVLTKPPMLSLSLFLSRRGPPSNPKRRLSPPPLLLRDRLHQAKLMYLPTCSLLGAEMLQVQLTGCGGGAGIGDTRGTHRKYPYPGTALKLMLKPRSPQHSTERGTVRPSAVRVATHVSLARSLATRPPGTKVSTRLKVGAWVTAILCVSCGLCEEMHRGIWWWRSVLSGDMFSGWPQAGERTE